MEFKLVKNYRRTKNKNSLFFNIFINEKSKQVEYIFCQSFNSFELCVLLLRLRSRRQVDFSLNYSADSTLTKFRNFVKVIAKLCTFQLPESFKLSGSLEKIIFQIVFTIFIKCSKCYKNLAT